MKKYSLIIFVLITLLATTLHVKADNEESYDVELTQSSDSDPEYVNNDPTKKRIPVRPILGIVSRDGLYIPSISPDDILSYEIYDSNGVCIGTFTSEYEFIQAIYSFTGLIEIRIHVDGYMLQGYITR